MNKIHRTIWNEARGCFVAANENTLNNGRSSTLTCARRTAMVSSLAAALTVLAAGPAQATELTVNTTGPYAYSSGSLVIDSGVTVSGSSSDSYAIEATGSDGATINNAGVVKSAERGIELSIASLSSVTNSGTLSGTGHGMELVNSTITGTLENSGLIIGNGAFGDSSGIRFTGSTGQWTEVNEILNDTGGTISGSVYGLNFQPYSQAQTIINNGLIYGGITGVYDGSTIGTLSNSGSIHGVDYGVRNAGLLSELDNSGTINGSVWAVYNTGTLSALNNSGLITGNLAAIYNTGTLGTVTNSGTIAGNIYNGSSGNLTIVGGSGSTFGTLTGYNGAIGSITNTASNLIFASGNILLNDNVNVGTHTLTNLASTLQINNHVTVTGNYTQNSGATLLFGVADGAVADGSISDTGYGRLYVTGNTTLTSGSTISLSKLNSYAFASGQRYVLIVTSGTASYNASSLDYVVSGYSGTLTGSSVTDGSNTDLVLTLGSSGSTPSNYATTNVAVSALNGLFKYTGTDASLLNVFNSAAAVGSTSEANKAGAQLSPTAVTSGLVQASASAAQTVATVTYAHIDGLRSGNGGNGSGVATGERSYDVGMWGQVFGGHANQSERDNVSGYRANYSGLLLAGDAQVGEQLRAGALFSYAKTSLSATDDNAGSSSSVNSYGLSAYAGYSGTPWYVNAMAGVAKQQYSTVRDIDYTGFSGVANGSFNGLQYSTSVQAGYPLNVEQWLPGVSVTPLAGLSYSVVHQDGYTESGGSGAALSVNAASTNSLKSELGVRMETAFDSSYGKLLPMLQLGWHHEYHDSRMQSSASFADDTTGTSSFVTQSASPIRNTGSLVLGLTLVQSKNLKIAARYAVEAGSGYTDQAASLQLRWQY